MADTLDKQERSRLMSRIGGKNTGPELRVRKQLHSLGYRIRLHVPTLPGTPDIVLRRHRTIIFVHGCFWHGHPGCARASRPSSNESFWNQKLDANMNRDAATRQELEAMGWKVLVIWECETRDPDALRDHLVSLMAVSSD